MILVRFCINNYKNVRFSILLCVFVTFIIHFCITLHENHTIMLINDFRKAIKARRKMLGITQTHLAELAGVSPNTVYKLERGQINPSLDIMNKILDVLGMELKLEVKQNPVK